MHNAQSSIDAPPKPHWAERLRSPARMSMVVIGAMIVAWIICVYSPLSQRMEAVSDRLHKAESRKGLAEEVQELRRQANLYSDRLPRGGDVNEWTQYLLATIRSQPVKLIRMDPRETTRLGPCKVLTWQIEMEGDLRSVGGVIEGLENGQRLIRIDRLILRNAADPTSERLLMAILVRGLDFAS